MSMRLFFFNFSTFKMCSLCILLSWVRLCLWAKTHAPLLGGSWISIMMLMLKIVFTLFENDITWMVQLAVQAQNAESCTKLWLFSFFRNGSKMPQPHEKVSKVGPELKCLQTTKAFHPSHGSHMGDLWVVFQLVSSTPTNEAEAL
jgi:hypothetical protein